MLFPLKAAPPKILEESVLPPKILGESVLAPNRLDELSAVLPPKILGESVLAPNEKDESAGFDDAAPPKIEEEEMVLGVPKRVVVDEGSPNKFFAAALPENKDPAGFGAAVGVDSESS